MKRWAVCFLILAVTLCFSGTALGKNYFLWDGHHKKLLMMGTNESDFRETVGLDHKPDVILPTNNPDQYLTVFYAQETAETVAKKQTIPAVGQIQLMNVATGKIADAVEIGYPPYSWSISEDHQHFFICYRSSIKATSVDLLHYDISAQTSERLEGFAASISKITVSPDAKSLYALGKMTGVKIAQLFVLSTSPLAMNTNVSAGKNPVDIYILGPDRLAILDLDLLKKKEKGFIRLMDTQENMMVEIRKAWPQNVKMQWFATQKVLILGFEEKSSFAVRSYFYKISAAGIRLNVVPAAFIDAKYLVNLDRLYVLTENNLKVIDYQNSTAMSADTAGLNNVPSKYKLSQLADTATAMIFNFENGIIKFFDLQQNKVINKIQSGRTHKKVWNAVFFKSNEKTDTMITTNHQKTKYYILNRATNDITVINEQFKILKYIGAKEPLLGIYQIAQPMNQTIVLTKTKVYKINDADGLESIYNLKSEPDSIRYSDAGNKVILMLDDNLLVFGTDPLEFKQAYSLVHRKQQGKVHKQQSNPVGFEIVEDPDLIPEG